MYLQCQTDQSSCWNMYLKVGIHNEHILAPAAKSYCGSNLRGGPLSRQRYSYLFFPRELLQPGLQQLPKCTRTLDRKEKDLKDEHNLKGLGVRGWGCGIWGLGLGGGCINE